MSAFRDPSSNRAVSRKFPRALSAAPARCQRFVPAKIRALRESRVAFARFERRTVLSLDRLSRTPSARRALAAANAKRRTLGTRSGAARRGKGKKTPGAEGETREEEAHTHARTHAHIRTHTNERYERNEASGRSRVRGEV